MPRWGIGSHGAHTNAQENKAQLEERGHDRGDDRPIERRDEPTACTAPVSRFFGLCPGDILAARKHGRRHLDPHQQGHGRNAGDRQITPARRGCARKVTTSGDPPQPGPWAEELLQGGTEMVKNLYAAHWRYAHVVAALAGLGYVEGRYGASLTGIGMAALFFALFLLAPLAYLTIGDPRYFGGSTGSRSRQVANGALAAIQLLAIVCAFVAYRVAHWAAALAGGICLASTSTVSGTVFYGPSKRNVWRWLQALLCSFVTAAVWIGLLHNGWGLSRAALEFLFASVILGLSLWIDLLISLICSSPIVASWRRAISSRRLPGNALRVVVNFTAAATGLIAMGSAYVSVFLVLFHGVETTPQWWLPTNLASPFNASCFSYLCL